LITFAFPGCIRYNAQPIDPGRRANALTNRKLALKTWTLASLTAEAIHNSPDIAVARALYRTARAAIGSAGERPNPTIALSPQIVTPFTDWITGTYSVDFDWTVETAGKRSRRIAIASQQANAAAARVIDAEWKVRAAVRKALLDLSAAERRMAVLAEANVKQADVVRLLDERIKAGAVSLLESAQPRLLAAQLRIQMSDVARTKALARAALAEALTMGTSGLDAASFSFAVFDGIPRKQTSHRRKALTHRSDILAALADYAATEAALRLEVAKQYPDLHLNPGYQLDAGENKWTVGIGLTLPILNQNRGPIHEAEAKRKEAEAHFDAVQAKALAECDRAAAGVTAALAKLATTDEMLAEQGRQIESLQRIVTAGEGDKLVLLSAEVEQATTRLSRVDALAELQAALGALEEATQTPLGK
jgi:outer membrane protein TolC